MSERIRFRCDECEGVVEVCPVKANTGTPRLRCLSCDAAMEPQWYILNE